MFSALLGMSLGVASVVGVHLLSAQVALSVAMQERAVADVDLYLQQSTLTEEDYFGLRARWRAGALPEVAALFPLLEGEVFVAGQSYLLVGTDPLAAIQEGPQSTSETVPAAQPDMPGLAQFLATDSVYLPRRGADEVDLWVSKDLRLAGREVHVLGYTAPAGMILADLPTARAILRPAGETTTDELRLTRIGVRLAPAAQPSGLGARLLRLAGNFFPGVFAEPEITPLIGLGEHWLQVAAAEQNPGRQLFRSVLFNIAALSVLALVVAWLLTYQVACHALGRREQMFERLQSLGVSQNRLRRLTQLEGVVLGIFATIGGVLVGLLLANLLLSLALGRSFELVLQVSEYAWIKALVSGIGVAWFSYWLAARQTLFRASQPKSLAVSSGAVTLPSHGHTVSARHLRWRSSLFATALLVLFCWGLWTDTLVGAFGCIVVSAVLLIAYLPTLMRRLWRRTLTSAKQLAAVDWRSSSTLKMLGLRQVLVGQELRLGVSALALALATALGISIMVDSFRVAFLAMLDQRLADDVVVRVKPDAQASTRTLLEAQVSNIVDSMVWRGAQDVSIRGISGRIEFAEDTAQLFQRFLPQDLSSQDLSGARAADGQAHPPLDTVPLRDLQPVYLNESFALAQRIAVGASVELTGSRGTVTAFVAGLFTDFGEVRPRLLAARSLVLGLHHNAPLDQLYLDLKSATNVRDNIKTLLTSSQVTLQDQAQVRRRSIEAFEQTFAITRALTWLALLVAAVALANALLAHGLQQQGTAYKLTVLGVSRASQRRLRRSRAIYVTGAAILLALPLGLLIAWILCALVNPRAYGWSFPLQLGFSGVGWPLLGGALGGLLAVALGDAWVRRQTVRLTQVTTLPLVAGLFLLMWLQGCSADAEPDPSAPVTALGSEPALRVGGLLSGEAQGFSRATKVVPFVFPQDHGSHPEFRSEWWYLTCPLRALTGEAEYGIQFTLFRQALVPPAQIVGDDGWRTGQVFMAHAALTDVKAGQHFEESRLVRGHPALAGVHAGDLVGNKANPFALWLEDWRLQASPTSYTSGLGTGPGAGLDELELEVRSTEFTAHLGLLAVKPLVLQGDRGLSYKGSREASYYYSLPRLAARGSITTTDAQSAVAVNGACWLDREWSTSVLASNLVGWDWFALQFDAGGELMLFQLREAASSATGANSLHASPEYALRQQGKRISENGSATSLAGSALHFQPQRYWQDETGVRWPIEWRIGTPDGELRIVAALDDQKMRSSIAYWEGLVWVYRGAKRVGQGYLEMTGYSVQTDTGGVRDNG